MNWPTIQILDVTIHCISFTGLLDQIDHWISVPSGPSYITHQICTVNPEFIIDAQQDPAFANVLGNADLCVPDGIGVLWAAKRQGIELPERVTGSDGIYHIAERAALAGWRIYFLGAAPGVAARAASLLAARNPGLQVAGTYDGSPLAEEWPEIQQRLQVAQPDILLVAYGHPKQDFWINRYRDQLPVKVAIGIGGAFDFVAGVTVRAPRWMQRLGLEWLHRLWREPWRWRRMLALPKFVWYVVTEK